MLRCASIRSVKVTSKFHLVVKLCCSSEIATKSKLSTSNKSDKSFSQSRATFYCTLGLNYSGHVKVNLCFS